MPSFTRRHLLAATTLLSLAAPGCLVRPVSQEEPTTKTTFTTEISQAAVDKVDLLLMIDSSSSMGDKQKILANAVPDLVRGLVEPRCVDKKTRTATGKRANPLAPHGSECAPGSEPAFAPITDMHIGVISSSLGGLGVCKGTDDRAHLLARREDGTHVAAAGDLNFLAWYPDVTGNQNKARHPAPPVPATTSLGALDSAFRDLVVGVGQNGCGFEAQLESVYRFLVQPDPSTGTEIVGDVARAKPEVDEVLLRQRAAFLRPDSLVAVVLLTDEDDASFDPLSVSGQGWRYGSEETNIPRATAACEKDPSAPACTTCASAPSDPACLEKQHHAEADGEINVRTFDMKRRFGVDPRFPIERYVGAFTESKIAGRASERVGAKDCTNPLFAARLPSSAKDELCKLPRGPRTKDLVYFGVIGGVPNQLLPASDDAAIDWTKLLGRDPARADETGIDPHMKSSIAPRAGLPAPTAPASDPVHGREWTTGGKDLQFACTFDLYDNVGGSPVPIERACEGDQCDCDGKSDSPLCSPKDKKLQIKGKAFPSTRELRVAKELGDHAIVASLCPKQLNAPSEDDYGYRPAVRAITSRLERSLVASCLPRPLDRDAKDGPVPCLVLATLPDPGDCAKVGLEAPDAAILKQHRDRVVAEEGEAAASLPVCVVPQIAVPSGSSCRDHAGIGFCYAEGIPGAACAQSLQFSQETARLQGARFSLQCIQVREPE